MRRFLLRLTCLLVVLLLAMPAVADTAAPLTGTWKCVAKREGQAVGDFKLELVQKDKNITGTASRSDGSADIRKGSFEDGKLKFVVEADGGNYEFDAAMAEGKLKGTILTPNGARIEWEGARDGAAAAAASAGVAGSWKIAAKAGERTVEYTLDLKKEDSGSLSGRMTAPDGNSINLAKVTFADNLLKFQVPTDDGNYEVEGKLDGDKLNGTYVSPNGRKDTWEAKRL